MERLRPSAPSSTHRMARRSFHNRSSVGKLASANVLCARIKSIQVLISTIPIRSKHLVILHSHALLSNKWKPSPMHDLSRSSQFLGTHNQRSRRIRATRASALSAHVADSSGTTACLGRYPIQAVEIRVCELGAEKAQSNPCDKDAQ